MKLTDLTTGLWVFLAGGLGCTLRYGLGLLLPASRFPWSILACNLGGCFLIGLLAGLWARPTAWQVGLITGLLGGFTTFSSFSQANLKLLSTGSIGSATLHIALTVGGGLCLTYLGYALVHQD